MTARKKVSVILPTYNRANSIGRAIDSVQKQLFSDWELIISDDGSEDDTIEVVKHYSALDPRIKIVCSDKNLGVGHARNMAAQRAIGKYLAFIDSDDKWLPEKLKKQVSLMDSLDDTWGASHTGAIVNLVNRKKRVLSRPKKYGHVFSDLLRFNAQIWTPTFMVRSKIFHELNGMDVKLLRHQDIDFFRRVAEQYKIAILPEPHAELYIYTNKLFGVEHIRAKEIMHKKYWEKTLEVHGSWVASKVWGREWLVASGCMFRAKNYKIALLYFLKAMRTNPFQKISDYARFILNIYRAFSTLPSVNYADANTNSAVCS
jgi:glycosyltransferase involved in cell wall biosynthesis